MKPQFQWGGRRTGKMENDLLCQWLLRLSFFYSFKQKEKEISIRYQVFLIDTVYIYQYKLLLLCVLIRYYSIRRK